VEGSQPDRFNRRSIGWVDASGEVNWRRLVQIGGPIHTADWASPIINAWPLIGSRSTRGSRIVRMPAAQMFFSTDSAELGDSQSAWFRCDMEIRIGALEDDQIRPIQTYQKEIGPQLQCTNGCYSWQFAPSPHFQQVRLTFWTGDDGGGDPDLANFNIQASILPGGYGADILERLNQ
jgi:hypothetical protein